jgi:hypothetical protein
LAAVARDDRVIAADLLLDVGPKAHVAGRAMAGDHRGDGDAFPVLCNLVVLGEERPGNRRRGDIALSGQAGNLRFLPRPIGVKGRQ